MASLPGDTIVWPDIKPMWFAYRNPVRGVCHRSVS